MNGVDELFDGAAHIVRQLRDAGHAAYLVGGCVRDRLLHRRPPDYDIATDARPDEVMALFRRTAPVGVQFGVVLVLLRQGEYEVATFRAEAEYTDGRRPDAIRFTDAREDVLRRDFTMNGLLEDPVTGAVEDFVGGVDDLEQGIVRAIGDPHARFGEDHLRVLRAVRFAASLGFDIEAWTLAACIEMAPLVARVSGERIRQELRRTFVEGDPVRGLVLLTLTGILTAVIPEAHSSDTGRAERILAELGPCELPLVLAALLPDLPPAEQRTMAIRLRLSNSERLMLGTLLETLPRFESLGGRAATLRLLREPHFGDAARLARAAWLADGRTAAPVDALLAERAVLTDEALFPPRLLTGRDLAALGLPPGPEFKRILAAVEDAQLDGTVGTAEQAMALARALADER